MARIGSERGGDIMKGSGGGDIIQEVGYVLTKGACVIKTEGGGGGIKGRVGGGMNKWVLSRGIIT